MDTFFEGEWKMQRYPNYFHSPCVQKPRAVIDVTSFQTSEEMNLIRLLCLEWTQTQKELKALAEQ